MHCIEDKTPQKYLVLRKKRIASYKIAFARHKLAILRKKLTIHNHHNFYFEFWVYISHFCFLFPPWILKMWLQLLSSQVILCEIFTNVNDFFFFFNFVVLNFFSQFCSKQNSIQICQNFLEWWAVSKSNTALFF